MMPFRRRTKALALALPILATGCVFHPKLTAYNDPQCNVNRHRLDLDVETMDHGNPCGNADPASCAAALLAIAGVTFTVSESIILVGNSALVVEKSGDNYWRKKKGNCMPTPEAEPAPLIASTQTDAASAVGAVP